MKRKDIIDAIVIILIVFILTLYNGALNAKCDLKQNRINELQNVVEQQVELIDALQQ